MLKATADVDEMYCGDVSKVFIPHCVGHFIRLNAHDVICKGDDR